MYDMMLIGQEIAERKSHIMSELNLEPQSFYLGTLHRPYNWMSLRCSRRFLRALPCWKSPLYWQRTLVCVKNLDQLDISVPFNVQLSKPLGYLDFITLQKHALRVITDSGGVQKEAFFVKTPCVTLRPETEWVETVQANANTLVKSRSAEELLRAVQTPAVPDYELQPYGAGNASQLIVDQLITSFF
jgi:UDP-GlcNAc3NAcA epimerase